MTDPYRNDSADDEIRKLAQEHPPTGDPVPNLPPPLAAPQAPGVSAQSGSAPSQGNLWSSPQAPAPVNETARLALDDDQAASGDDAARTVAAANGAAGGAASNVPSADPIQSPAAQPDLAQPGYVQPGQTQPGYTQPGYSQPGYTQPGYAQSAPEQPTSSTPSGTQRRRGPGWPGVILVGAGAALASSLLTAGLVNNSNTSNTSNRPAATSTATSESSAPAAANGISAPDWSQVAKTVEPSVVAVKIAQNNRLVGEGSGVILDAKGHIVTNAHVVSEVANASISVVLADGRIYPVKILGTDPSTDLAVLLLENPPSDIAPATFADSSTVQVGQPVMAVGNPLGLAETATTGIVSALDRPVSTGSSQNQFGQSTGEQVVTNAIQTDAAINPGNSGGALVDAKGQVIGITSSIASLNSGSGNSQSGSIGLGFAIPSSMATNIANEIITSGKADHAYLGVNVGDTQVAVDGATRQAALISNVGANTPAAQAGLKAQDAVTAVNGKTVESADSLVARVRELQPGDKVALTVVRDGKSQDVEVTLAQRPATN